MNYIEGQEIKDIVKNALKEDIGAKDVTTKSLIAPKKFVKTVLLAKEPCVVCGLGIARLAFKQMDKNIKFHPLVKDGDFVKKGKILARISGRARPILTGERVALNFLCFFSGISTNTRNFVNAVKPHKTKILDTRKTIPGLRLLQKYAVRIGGGFNHRMSLDEMIMVKDNHIKAISRKLSVISLKNIIEKNPNKIFKSKKIEIEVNNLKEFKDALKLNPNVIMLDNMSIKEIRKAVKLRNNLSPTTYNLQPKLEASGGITLKNAKKVASAGVDFISVGALTHSVSSVDISLEVI